MNSDCDADGTTRKGGALARGLGVLRTVAAAGGALATGEIAARTGLPKPTVSRLAATLCKLGYLRAAADGSGFFLTTATLGLGYAVLARAGIVEIARPFMEELAASGEVAVAISVRSGLAMMYVELVRRPEAIVLSLQTGSRVPLHLTASGRAWLAAAGGRERESAMSALRDAYGADWPAMRTRLDAAIAQAERAGYAASLGDWRPEHHAIGVALAHPATGDLYTLSLGGLASVLPPARIEENLAPRLLAAAAAIRAALTSRR
ncbi:IclR family transcriptional regulator [Marinimicrococcus flavescens]|uniref:IclR family transcriptional regulator n=1 Tax=Marinimicrococcus flavescens TaxID=3031815 RepID=A0AAP3XRY5_9PROT|nr:IclR family transcriptional regulator [Marinimicrococcus flavescens]